LVGPSVSPSLGGLSLRFLFLSLSQVLVGAAKRWQDESHVKSQHTGLVWLDFLGTHACLLQVQVRVSFSERVPLTGQDVLVHQREAWIAQARRLLASDLMLQDKEHEKACMAIRRDAAARGASLCHTVYLSGRRHTDTMDKIEGILRAAGREQVALPLLLGR
jgi:hypothetical protein